MAAKKKAASQEFEYKAEMKQLLHLIIHSLYTHPEVFLRELISNASDALNKVRFRQLTDKNILNPDLPLRINISVDEKKQLFSIEDTGIGMNQDDLMNRIGTIASSGTLEFLEQLKKEGKSIDSDLIGQFGIGFYSVFMVTDEVTIETRHADNDSQGLLWTSVGEGKFRVEEIDRKQRGTKISFKLKDSAKEFAEEFNIKQTIKKYSNFVDYPIYLGQEEVNSVSALWHRGKDEIKDDELEEFYKFISNDYNAPLGHLHLSIEGRVNFKALIFVPETAPLRLMQTDDLKSLHLYSSKVFIQDDCKELLPEYLRFLVGVVDTEDLPLNVSREVTQSSPVMTKIREVLTTKSLALLEEWSRKEPEKFDKFYTNFGSLFKTGLNSDFKNKDKLVELLRFESTKTEKGKMTTLKDYVANMSADQKEIYYLAGEHREVVERNPNLEYFKKNDIEVLLMLDPIDLFVMPSINEYEKKPLKAVEKADLDLAEGEKAQKGKLKKAETEKLLARFKEALGDKIEDVIPSKRLVDSPATLVVGADGMDSQMEQMMKMMNKDFSASKKILEINTSHPLIKNIAKLNEQDPEHPIVEKCVMQIFEGALLIRGDLDSSTEFVNRMNDIMETATS